MSIDVNDIDKYIFNPQNPKQCKSYTLLLKIAKKENLVYISDDFIATVFENVIINNDFKSELWDIPDNFEDLDVGSKVKLFKKQLSEEEYYEYIDSLDIREEHFLFNKIFDDFIDIHPYGYIAKLKKYDRSLLKGKLVYNSSYSFSGYKLYKDTYTFVQSYLGNKIFFTNNEDDLVKYNAIFDKSSVVVTTNQNIFIDIKKSAATNKIILRHDINKNIKPIFLKKISDMFFLLKVLQEDLKKESVENEKATKKNIYNISKIRIENFFSIKDINLESLQDKKEIYIVGENGDGKTLLLQAIALGLKGIEEGDVFNLVKSQKEYSLNIEDSNKNIYTSTDETYKNFFAYGVNRNNNCRGEKDEVGYLTLFTDSFDLKNPIEWLKYLDHSEKSDKENIITVANAKKLLQELLESDVEIEIEPDQVIFSEKGSVVSFEQLSAGYKGVLTIVADLLVRLSENQPYVESIEEFRGIVVIDEVELHLHPKWKYSFVEKLRSMFPNIQFIMTTHSPTVLLGASSQAVFYKIYKEDGEVKISNQIVNEGYTNNTLVSSPLFDLESVTSRVYDKKLSSDDYIYEKIHQKVSQKIQKESLTDKERIAVLIEEELAKL